MEEAKMTHESKKRKTSNQSKEVTLGCGLSVSLQDFKVTTVLNEKPEQKVIFLEGKFSEREDPAVVILEKTPFKKSNVGDIVRGETGVNFHLKNDVYNTLDLIPPPAMDALKTTIIYPATKMHIEKYSKQHVYLVYETASDYMEMTLPFLSTSQFNIQWVYNILNRVTESERIIFEDDDPEIGFVLLPDLKWTAEQMEDLYLICIVHKCGIKSLRDLNQSHLPLLRNILEKGMSAIESKYQVPSSCVKAYFHYQPSYYHLHVHFTHIMFNAPGSGVERAHLLTDVIENIELMSDYYQTKTLVFTARENERLFKVFQTAGRI